MSVKRKDTKNGIFVLDKGEVNVVVVSSMRNGIVTTDLFVALDTIREKYEVTDVRWSDVAGIRPPRISEWRRLAKNPGAKVGRAFTPDKYTLLLAALYKILGEESVRKEMKELIQKTNDTGLKIHLSETTLDEEKLAQLWLYLQALAGTK